MDSVFYEISRALADDVSEIMELQRRAYISEAEIYGDYSIQPLTQTLEEAVSEFAEAIVLKAVDEKTEK